MPDWCLERLLLTGGSPDDPAAKFSFGHILKTHEDKATAFSLGFAAQCRLPFPLGSAKLLTAPRDFRPIHRPSSGHLGQSWLRRSSSVFFSAFQRPDELTSVGCECTPVCCGCQGGIPIYCTNNLDAPPAATVASFAKPAHRRQRLAALGQGFSIAATARVFTPKPATEQQLFQIIFQSVLAIRETGPQ